MRSEIKRTTFWSVIQMPTFTRNCLQIYPEEFWVNSQCRYLIKIFFYILLELLWDHFLTWDDFHSLRTIVRGETFGSLSLICRLVWKLRRLDRLVTISKLNWDNFWDIWFSPATTVFNSDLRLTVRRYFSCLIMKTLTAFFLLWFV